MKLCECNDPKPWERSDGVLQCNTCALPLNGQDIDCLHERSEWIPTVKGNLMKCSRCGFERLIVSLSQR
jgi:hypothetical protein